MAKTDRNASTRAALTGEPYQQALKWIREHGLTSGPVPDANTSAQQILEAAALRLLARPPLNHHDSMFGIARVTPDIDTLTLWPAPGAAIQVLTRILPAITADTRTGVPTLRLVPGPGKHLTLRTEGLATLLVRATVADHGAARELMVELGSQLLQDTPGDDELAEWQRAESELAGEAHQWSTALRRAGLFMNHTPDWTLRAPSRAETDVPAGLVAARPHGPATPTRLKATIAVTSDGRGGQGRSTLALTLAEELARTGSSVLLLTADQYAHRALKHRGVAPWPAAGQESGPARGSVAATLWDERRDVDLVERARTKADIVVLDTQFDYRPGIVPVDVNVVVSRYRPDHWQGQLIDDRRSREIRILEWLSEQFGHFQDRADWEDPLETDERALRNLLTYLDDNFYCYVRARQHDGREDVYDRGGGVLEFLTAAVHFVPVELDEIGGCGA